MKLENLTLGGLILTLICSHVSVYFMGKAAGLIRAREIFGVKR